MIKPLKGFNLLILLWFEEIFRGAKYSFTSLQQHLLPYPLELGWSLKKIGAKSSEVLPVDSSVTFHRHCFKKKLERIITIFPLIYWEHLRNLHKNEEIKYRGYLLYPIYIVKIQQNWSFISILYFYSRRGFVGIHSMCIISFHWAWRKCAPYVKNDVVTSL